jgi:DNA-binding CsgD family transcriptional regulator
MEYGTACVVVGGVCALAMACSLGMDVSGESDDARASRAGRVLAWHRGSSTADVALAFLVGVGWEESWRGRSYFAMDVPFVTVVLALIAIAVWMLAGIAGTKEGKACPEVPVKRRAAAFPPGYESVPLILGSCVGIVGALLILRNAGAFFALLSLSFVMFLACHFAGGEAGRPSARGVSAMAELIGAQGRACATPLLLALAGGLCCGVYAGNLMGSEMLSLASSSVEGARVANMAVGATLCVICIAVSALEILEIIVRERRYRLADELGLPEGSQRMRGRLIEAGLDDLQVRIVTMLLEGHSTVEIARNLHYSRSAINVQRREAFALLGVVDASQLALELLREDTSGERSVSSRSQRL